MPSGSRSPGPTTRAVALVIKVLRVARGYSAPKFAGLARISLSTFNLLESGDRISDLEQLTRIAAALGIPLKVLIETGHVPEDAPFDTNTKHRVARRAAELAGKGDDLLHDPQIDRALRRQTPPN